MVLQYLSLNEHQSEHQPQIYSIQLFILFDKQITNIETKEEISAMHK